MDLYKVKIPLDSFDIITGTTVISGVTEESGYVWLTKTGDTFVSLFLTSDYDDIGIYTDFNNRDIFEMITKVPVITPANTVAVPPCSTITTVTTPGSTPTEFVLNATYEPMLFHDSDTGQILGIIDTMCVFSFDSTGEDVCIYQGLTINVQFTDQWGNVQNESLVVAGGGGAVQNSCGGYPNCKSFFCDDPNKIMSNALGPIQGFTAPVIITVPILGGGPAPCQTYVSQQTSAPTTTITTISTKCEDIYDQSSDLPDDTIFIHPDGRLLYNITQTIYRLYFKIEYCDCPIPTPIVTSTGIFSGGDETEIDIYNNSFEYNSVQSQIPAGNGILTTLTFPSGCIPKVAYLLEAYAATSNSSTQHAISYVGGCVPCCDEEVQYVEVENGDVDYEPCEGELLNITMTGGEFDALIIDPGGPYETIFTVPGGSMCLPIGCYELMFNSFGESTFNIKDEYGIDITLDSIGARPPLDEIEDDEVGHQYLYEICISCKIGKLEIATHRGSLISLKGVGYTGATAYVMATSCYDSWTVTGTTGNNMMVILPIAGITGLTTTVHAKYDANENPIVVTATYGTPPHATGADYNIGSASTVISYTTVDINNVITSFSFERDCCEECYGLNTKEEMKMGWVFDPKINVNVFIDRGQNLRF